VYSYDNVKDSFQNRQPINSFRFTFWFLYNLSVYLVKLLPFYTVLNVHNLDARGMRCEVQSHRAYFCVMRFWRAMRCSWRQPVIVYKSGNTDLGLLLEVT